MTAGPRLSEGTAAFARSGAFAALTTLRPDGSPTTQMMWVDADDEHILINTEVHRRKFRDMREDPRVVVMILDPADPYTYVEVRGVVESTETGPAARAHIDELSWRYHGRAYQERIITSERVIVRIRPTRVIAHGALSEVEGGD